MNKFFLLILALLMGQFAQAQCITLGEGPSPLTPPLFICVDQLPLQLNGCEGGNFSITPGVLPSSGSYIFNPLNPGVYTVTCTAPDGSTCTETIQVSDVSQAAEILAPTVNFFCGNSLDTVFYEGNIATGAYFLLDGAVSNYFIPAQLTPGNYVLKYNFIDPVSSCTTTDSTGINILAPPDMTTIGLQSEYCVNSEPTLLTTPALDETLVSYSGTGITILNTFDPNEAGVGTHEVTVVYEDFSNFCIDSITLTTTVTEFLLLDFESIASACYHEVDTIVYTGDHLGDDVTYLWDITEGEILLDDGDTIVVQWDSAGEHLITLDVENALCPTASVSQPITKIGISVTASATPELIETYEQTQLNALAEVSDGGEATFLWSPNYNISCIDCASPLALPEETSTYTVLATSADGCEATDSVTIRVVSDRSIYIPNIFTPNEDGNNDNFLILGKGIEAIELSIFDRWGSKIYYTNDVDKGWDGSSDKKMVNAGVYMYMVEIIFYDGQKEQRKGNITLIR